MPLTPRDYATDARDAAEKQQLISQGKASAYRDMALRLDPDLFCQDCGEEYSKGIGGTSTREIHEPNCPSRIRTKPRRAD